MTLTSDPIQTGYDLLRGWQFNARKQRRKAVAPGVLLNPCTMTRTPLQAALAARYGYRLYDGKVWR